MDMVPADNNRSTVITEPNLMPPDGIGIPATSGESFLRTPFVGNVRALPPPLPQPPTQLPIGATPYGVSGGYGTYSGAGYGSGYNSYFGNNYGRFGGVGGNYGMFGSYGASGGYNYYGGNSINPMDPESRFIQIAEASSRPAFQSIEALVSAISNIASMLDSTFFALTSSFRAILGVAANFGRLRGVFAQFWHTFTIFKGFIFIYRKLLYWLRISKIDPSSAVFKQAFAEAMNASISHGSSPSLPRKGESPWPVFIFLSFIFTAPYLIMKLLGTVTNTSKKEAENPARWANPIQTVALYDFQARNPGELTIRAGDRLLIAPKEIQHTHGLLNTGWGLATVDGEVSGMIPINYVKSPQQLRQERQQLPSDRQSESQEVKSHIQLEPKYTENNITTIGDEQTRKETERKEAFNDNDVFD